jgi:hypothetical protein
VLVRGPGGHERSVAVDTVVFSGDFVPDNELARLAGLAIDPGTRGPACAAGGVTTGAGVFAAGNVVHPAETADVAAQRALSVGRAAAEWLHQGEVQTVPNATERVLVAAPLRWVVPNRASPGGRGGEPVLLRARVFLDHPRVEVTQGGRLLASYRLRNMTPNRSHHIPSDWWARVRPDEDVLISVSSPVVRTSGPGSSPSGR